MCLLSFYCSWVNACVGSFLAVNVISFRFSMEYADWKSLTASKASKNFSVYCSHYVLKSLSVAFVCVCAPDCEECECVSECSVCIHCMRVCTGRSYENLYTCRGTCTHINAPTVTLAPAMSTKRNVSTIGERGLVAHTVYAAVYHCTVYTQQIYPFLLFAKSISSVWRISSNDVIDM